MKKTNVTLAPIVLFVYNRPWHTQQTIKALQHCDLASESDLYIFADGPKANATEKQEKEISEVRKYIRTITGFSNIIIEESEKNKGLANSVINGVSKVIEKYGDAIILEDDILTHPFFLRFMNDALDFYKKDKRIFSIGAFMDDIIIPEEYKQDVFVCRRVETQGWATWLDRWSSACWDVSDYAIIKHPTRKRIRQICKGGDDLWPLLQMQAAGTVDSWAARWQYNLTLSNGYCLRPITTFVNNIGMDGTGIHSGNTLGDKYNIQQQPTIWESHGLPSTPIYNHPRYDIKMVESIEEDRSLIFNLQSHFASSTTRPNIWKRVKRCIKRIINHKTNDSHER